MNIAASSFDAASASQVKLKDAYLGGLKEKQQGDLAHEREENVGETDNSESAPWYYRPAPQNDEACGKPIVGGSAEFVSSEFQKSQSNKGATMKHFLAITVEHINTPLPRSTSFPTRCCVWEEWGTIPINLGRTRLSGIQRPTSSAN